VCAPLEQGQEQHDHDQGDDDQDYDAHSQPQARAAAHTFGAIVWVDSFVDSLRAIVRVHSIFQAIAHPIDALASSLSGALQSLARAVHCFAALVDEVVEAPTARYRLVVPLAPIICADGLVPRLQRLSLHAFPTFSFATLLSVIVCHLITPFLVDANSTCAHVEQPVILLPTG